MQQTQVTDPRGKPLSFNGAIAKITAYLQLLRKTNNKVMLIGNGGSASIANHIATDLLKNCSVPAIAFNDATLLTCLSNDLGYECVFAKPVEMLAKKGDLLFAISSSGKSENILRAVRKAKDKGCFVITLSGFKKSNPLRKIGDINFYVPSLSYGFVEIAHLAICHYSVDKIIEKLSVKSLDTQMGTD